MKKIILLIFFLTFFISCKNMYSKVFDKSYVGKNIKCLKITGKDMFLNKDVSKIVEKYGFKTTNNCPFVLKVYAMKLSQCNSPKGKSTGADFDGYLRFSLYKGNHLIYRCQEDYKGEFGNYLIEDLVKKMKKDLKI